jgi:rubrerythrin
VHLPRLHELLLEALETEIGGVLVYEAALECAVDPRLHEEWDKYLDETKRHVDVLRQAFADLGLDPAKETPGRALVRAKGRALVATMAVASKAGDPVAAQIVAAECVVDAETKDHANWSLLEEIATSAGDARTRSALARAVGQVEDEEDEHLYHSMGWARELWLSSLGLPAELPPPEERRDVRSMAAAAEARESRRGR